MFQPLFLLADGAVLLVHLLVVFTLQLQKLLLGLQDFVLFNHLALLFSIFEHLLALGQQTVAQCVSGEPYAHAAAYNDSDNDSYSNHSV